MGLMIQKASLTEGTTPSTTFNIMAGRNRPPENVVLAYNCNANIDSETLDVHGMAHGSSEYATLPLVSQMTQAADANVIVPLSGPTGTGVNLMGPACWKIKVTSGTLAATEQVDLFLMTW